MLEVGSNQIPVKEDAMEDVSPKSRLATTLFAWFLGVFGAHRFYLGKTWTGILMRLTGGLFGAWTLLDFILILFRFMKDKQGLPVKEWSEESMPYL